MATYRFYYNRANEAPQVWSVDEGDQGSEINVIAVRCMVPSVSVVGPDVPEDERQNKPRVWMEARGHLYVIGGIAVIEHPYAGSGLP